MLLKTASHSLNKFYLSEQLMPYFSSVPLIVIMTVVMIIPLFTSLRNELNSHG